MQGEIVKASDPVLLRHVQTCVYLASDNQQKYKNDFGTENEVCCHNHSTLNKSQNLALENNGQLTSDIPTKFQEDKNVFFLQTAPEAQYARNIEDLQKFDFQDLLKDLRQKIFLRSAFGVRALDRIFKAMDADGSNDLDQDDFRWGLMDFGIQISKDEAAEVLKNFDKNGNGKVSFSEFLSTLRVSLLFSSFISLIRDK